MSIFCLFSTYQKSTQPKLSSNNQRLSISHTILHSLILIILFLLIQPRLANDQVTYDFEFTSPKNELLDPVFTDSNLTLTNQTETKFVINPKERLTVFKVSPKKVKISIRVIRRGGTIIIPILSKMEEPPTPSPDGDNNQRRLQKQSIEDVLQFEMSQDFVLKFNANNCDWKGAIYQNNILEISKDFEGEA